MLKTYLTLSALFFAALLLLGYLWPPALWLMSLLNISGTSFGALSRNAILALNRGAKLGHFYHNRAKAVSRRVRQFEIRRYDQIFPYVPTGSLLNPEQAPEDYRCYMVEASPDFFEPNQEVFWVQSSASQSSERATEIQPQPTGATQS